MRHEEHCRRSLEEFGSRHDAVHEYLDQYAARWRGGIHRVLLHHALGVDLVVATLGEWARRPAEQHILDDFGGIPAAPDDPFMKLRCWYPLNEGAEVLAELKRLYARDFDLVS